MKKISRFCWRSLARCAGSSPTSCWSSRARDRRSDTCGARRWSSNSKGNVRFIGYLKRGPALSDCYCAGDAFIFASATETQGLVLLEAMALGVPLVSTAVMGTRDILDAGRGALVADGTVHDFAGKVVRLLRDRGLRERLGGEARQYAGEWSAEAMARRLVEFYLRVIAAYCRATC